jgi:DNA sulfur modification protein DndB
MDMSLTFPAMRGTMGGDTYYVAMVKMRNVPTLFDTYLDRKIVQAQEKQALDLQREAQRRLNLRRVPEISEYIRDAISKKSRYGYVFNSITVNCEADLVFEEFASGSDLGALKVTSFDKFTVADGQHRLLGIKDALTRTGDKKFRDETLAVVFFDVRNRRSGQADLGRMHQIFTDLNRNAQKVQGGVLIGMGNQPNEIITRRLVDEIPFFEDLVECERNNPTLSSEAIFSLNVIKHTVDILIGPRSTRDQIEANLQTVKSVWAALIGHMPLWQAVAERELDAATVKKRYVCTHAVVIRSLAAVMARVWLLPEARRGEFLQQIAEIDWRKTNPFFRNKILNEQGGIINNKSSERLLVRNLLKKFELDDVDEL